MFTTLINNALESIEEQTDAAGDRYVELNYSLADSQLVVDINDSGPKIPAEVEPNIFQSGFSSKTNRLNGGCGIGLNIARSLLNRMHGKLVLSRPIGRMGKFTLFIPLVEKSAVTIAESGHGEAAKVVGERVKSG